MAEPQVSHSLDGDARILSATMGTRATVRTALTSFQKDILKLENTPCQIKADIKIRVSGESAKEHTYTVTITSNDFDTAAFTKVLLQSANRQQYTSGASASSPAVSKPTNGPPATPSTSTPRGETRKEPEDDDDDDDVVELRPFKRPKTTPSASSPKPAGMPTADPLEESHDYARLVASLESWKTDWVQQGGWLYDNITKLSATMTNTRLNLEQKMGVVQDVLGQSINASNASTMNELANISKLVPWVENCRKISSDKSQAREEKWRTSSATFHDESRRDREAAEKRIEKKLEEQNELLMKLAQANGIDLDDAEEDNNRASREESLGAQLTAELSQEASTTRPISRYDKETGTITING